MKKEVNLNYVAKIAWGQAPGPLPLHIVEQALSPYIFITVQRNYKSLDILFST